MTTTRGAPGRAGHPTVAGAVRCELAGLPGRSVDALSTLPLRAYLRSRGHRPVGWTLGVNDGDLRRLVPLVAGRVDELADRLAADLA